MITNERPCGLPVVMLAFLIAMFSSKTVLSGDTRKIQSTIKNDTRYVDTDGKELALGDGGQITRIDGVYYWVGNEPDKTHGCDIHMYSSRTMENGSWKHEGKIWDFPDGQYGGNCNLVFCPNTKNYVIIAKGLHFLESSTVTGPYKLARKLIGQNTPRKWGFGGLSVYREGNEAYLISSRHTKTVKPPLNRFFGIYRLTPDFLNIETELLWENFTHREAPWIVKRNGMYYMTYSATRGWKPSHCYFKTAATLSGPWSEERQIKMIPERTERIAKSHSSQHRYIRRFGDQWVFGGDRYPVQEPGWYGAEKGRHIMCPVIWEDDVPVVIWKEEWELKLPGDVAGK